MDGSHDVAFRWISKMHQPSATVAGQLVGLPPEQGCKPGLDRLRQRRPRLVAQNLGQRIGAWPDREQIFALRHSSSLSRIFSFRWTGIARPCRQDAFQIKVRRKPAVG